MKKALFVLEDLNGTGSPLTVLHIIQNLPSDIKITVLILCGNSKDDLVRKELFEKQGCSVYVLNVPHLYTRKFKIFYHHYLHLIKKSITEFFKINQFDYCYLNRFNIAGPICLTIKRKFKNTTIIFNALGNIDSKYGNGYVTALFNSSLKKLCKYSDYYVSISEQCFTKKFPIKGKRIVLHDYSNIEIKTDSKIFSKKNVCRLGQIGYFSDNKNQLFSLSLVRKLNDKGYDADLHLIGFPTNLNYYSLLKSFINDNDLGKKVYMLDKNFDKIDFFDCIDLLLIPSKSEGFPLVIKESLSRKTPIIGSNAIPFEAEVDGVTILSLDDPDKWLKVIADEAYKKQISSLDLVKDKENFKNIVERIFN